MTNNAAPIDVQLAANRLRKRELVRKALATSGFARYTGLVLAVLPGLGIAIFTNALVVKLKTSPAVIYAFMYLVPAVFVALWEIGRLRIQMDALIELLNGQLQDY